MLAPWIESNSLVSKSVSGKEVLLNSGYKMPVIGLGTWTQDDKSVEMSVYEAIKDGYPKAAVHGQLFQGFIF